MYYVYRYMLDDQWIYVGKSERNLDQRIYDHSRDDRFKPYKECIIEYCELKTKSDMDLTESMLIKTMHPVINVADRTDGSIPFVYSGASVEWKPYSSFVCNEYTSTKAMSTEEVGRFLDDIVERYDLTNFSNDPCAYHEFIYSITIPDLATLLIDDIPNNVDSFYNSFKDRACRSALYKKYYVDVRKKSLNVNISFYIANPIMKQLNKIKIQQTGNGRVKAKLPDKYGGGWVTGYDVDNLIKNAIKRCCVND